MRVAVVARNPEEDAEPAADLADDLARDRHARLGDALAYGAHSGDRTGPLLPQRRVRRDGARSVAVAEAGAVVRVPGA